MLEVHRGPGAGKSVDYRRDRETQADGRSDHPAGRGSAEGEGVQDRRGAERADDRGASEARDCLAHLVGGGGDLRQLERHEAAVDADGHRPGLPRGGVRHELDAVGEVTQGQAGEREGDNADRGAGKSLIARLTDGARRATSGGLAGAGGEAGDGGDHGRLLVCDNLFIQTFG